MKQVSIKLRSYGIRPSVQRTAIYQYLLEHSTHPTVDEIYVALYPKIPTLSKTTIYNTLSLFAERGAVLVLNLDGKNQHFDGDTKDHAHFLCTGCGKIHDLPYPDFQNLHVPDDFHVQQTEINLYGVCSHCQKP